MNVNRGQVKIWDIASLTAVKTWGTNGFKEVAWSPDGKRVLGFASGPSFSDPTIHVYDASNGNELSVWETDQFGAERTCFQGQYFAHAVSSAVHDGKRTYGKRAVVVRDAVTGHERWRFADRSAWVNSAIAFDSRANRLAVGGFDTLSQIGEVVIWDLNTGQQIRRLPTHDQRPGVLAFHPKNNRLLSGGGQTLILWDLATGQELLIFTGQSLPTVSLAGALAGWCPCWSPDGKFLAVGNSGQLELWDATLGYEHAEALPLDYFRNLRVPGPGSAGGFF